MTEDFFAIILLQAGLISCYFYVTVEKHTCWGNDMVLSERRLDSLQACQDECSKRPTCVAVFYGDSYYKGSLGNNLCYPKRLCDTKSLMYYRLDGSISLMKCQVTSMFRATSSSGHIDVMTDGLLDTCVNYTPDEGVTSWGFRMTCTHLTTLKVYYNDVCDIQATVYVVGQPMHHSINQPCQQNLTVQCMSISQTPLTAHDCCVVQYKCDKSYNITDVIIYNPKQPICEIEL